MNAIEIAEWLNNADGTGATDEEFAEVFALMDRCRNGRGFPMLYNTPDIIGQMDVDAFCKYLKTVLTEIQNNATD